MYFRIYNGPYVFRCIDLVSLLDESKVLDRFGLTDFVWRRILPFVFIIRHHKINYLAEITFMLIFLCNSNLILLLFQIISIYVSYSNSFYYQKCDRNKKNVLFMSFLFSNYINWRILSLYLPYIHSISL